MGPARSFREEKDEPIDGILTDGAFELGAQPDERRFQALVEQLPLVSYAKRGNEQGVAYISPQIFTLVGCSAEEWAADPSFFVNVLHPADRARVLAGVEAMHESGAPFDCEYRLTARDGRSVWIDDAAVVVGDPSGGSDYAQGCMIDITQRKRAEAALLASQAQLHQQIERIEYQALHDSLTDLPNRTLFRDRTQPKAAYRRNVADWHRQQKKTAHSPT